MDINSLLEKALSYTRKGLDRYGYVTRSDLGLREIRDAVVTPRQFFPDQSFAGAVYDGRHELIRSTLRFNEDDIVPVDTSRLDDLSSLSATKSDHPTAIYGGILFPILGHFFFESLSRFWPLLSQAAGTRATRPIFFHSWPMLEFHRFMANPLYSETLEAFGFDSGNVYIIERPMSFDTLQIADTASVYHSNLDERMQQVFDHVANRILRRHHIPAPIISDRKVYLSRSNWSDNRRILNETVIDEQMARRGFEVVHPQTLPPHALISMLRSVGTLVSTDGSHAHLAAFCNPGIRTVMLDTRSVPTQFAIAKLRRFQAFHVPLFETPLYRFETGITDPDLLGHLIDRAIA